MIDKLPKDWQGPARNTVMGSLGALAVHGIVGAVSHVYSRGEDETEEDDWANEMIDVYLDKGPDGLARHLKRHDDDVKSMREAHELVEDFEADNERTVRRYERYAASDGDSDGDEAPPRRRRRGSRSQRATTGPRLETVA